MTDTLLARHAGPDARPLDAGGFANSQSPVSPERAELDEILRRRARRLAARGESAGTETGDMPTLVFAVKASPIGLDLRGVQEVSAPRAVTPLPSSSPAVAGVVNLRGELWCVLSLRKVLHGDGEDAPSGPLVFLRKGRVAVQVDTLLRITRYRSDELRPAGTDQPTRIVRAIAPDGCAMIDIDAFLARATSSSMRQGPPIPDHDLPATRSTPA